MQFYCTHLSIVQAVIYVRFFFLLACTCWCVGCLYLTSMNISEETGDTNVGGQSDTFSTRCGLSGDVKAHRYWEGFRGQTNDGEETEDSEVGENPPFPTRSYNSPGGDFLHLFQCNNQHVTRSIHFYSPWIIRADDDSSLTAQVEVDDSERGFTIGVCGAEERVVGTFFHYFSSGETMLPMPPQVMQRCCICPWHRRALLLAFLDDRIISCIQLPSSKLSRSRNMRARSEEGQEDVLPAEVSVDALTTEDAWRVVIEHEGRGFVRFYGVERRKGFCFCDAPISHIT